MHTVPQTSAGLSIASLSKYILDLSEVSGLLLMFNRLGMGMVKDFFLLTLEMIIETRKTDSLPLPYAWAVEGPVNLNCRKTQAKLSGLFENAISRRITEVTQLT